MSSKLPVLLEKQAIPDNSYWLECKRRAEILNIPAWMIAEEGFRHPEKIHTHAKK